MMTTSLLKQSADDTIVRRLFVHDSEIVTAVIADQDSWTPSMDDAFINEALPVADNLTPNHF